jgi:hypothetical protein
MGLDKSIEHGKEHRAPYHRSGKFDRTCRPGGSCPWCQSNRTIQAQREEGRAEVNEWDLGTDDDPAK